MGNVGKSSRDTSEGEGPVVLINTFYPRPGKLDEFLEMQIAEARHLGDAARALGWLGNRIHRARNNQKVVVVTAFTSMAAKEQWARSDLFIEHRRRIEPLLERVESDPFDLVFKSGDL